MILTQFENGRKLDGKKSLQDFNAKEKYLYPKNRPVSMQKRRKMFYLHHCRVFTRCFFKYMLVRVPFSKSSDFEICRQKMCRFRVNGRPIRHIFHRFQNVPASCERSLSLIPHCKNSYPSTAFAHHCKIAFSASFSSIGDDGTFPF